MIITEEFLNSNNACLEGLRYFNSLQQFDLKYLINHAIDSNNRLKLQWANWLIVRCMNRVQKVQYAIFAAEQVLHIFEKKYPQDDRPRKAIEAAKNCLKENFSKESISVAKNRKNRAADAAYAAYAYAADAYADAAYAAYAYAADAYADADAADADAAYADAAYAAYAAAAYAADADADADAAAYAYAYAYAYADADADAKWNEMQIKILQNGIKILEL